MSTRKQIQQKRQAYWQKVIRRWKASGLSVREYCRQHKIPETSFYQGRRRWAGSSGRPRKAVSSDSFVEVRLESSSVGSPHLEIIWAQPPVIKVHAGCEGTLLEHILRCLREQPC